jgi:hypothetical protein
MPGAVHAATDTVRVPAATLDAVLVVVPGVPQALVASNDTLNAPDAVGGPDRLTVTGLLPLVVNVTPAGNPVTAVTLVASLTVNEPVYAVLMLTVVGLRPVPNTGVGHGVVAAIVTAALVRFTPVMGVRPPPQTLSALTFTVNVPAVVGVPVMLTSVPEIVAVRPAAPGPLNVAPLSGLRQ